MNKEQAQAEYLKLLQQKIDAEEKIMEEAKKKGTWKQGLDSNNELFAENNKKFNEKIKLLKTMIDD